MASSDQDIVPTETRQETLQTESNVTTTAANTKPDDGNTVMKPVLDLPKPAIVQTDGDDKPDTAVGEDENPVYSDDEDFPTFDGGQPRGKINHPVVGSGGKPQRPTRP